jgi:hypothetical protein
MDAMWKEDDGVYSSYSDYSDDTDSETDEDDNDEGVSEKTISRKNGKHKRQRENENGDSPFSKNEKD